MHVEEDVSHIEPRKSIVRGKKRKFDHTKKFGVKKRRLDVEAEEIEAIEQKLIQFKSDQVKAFSDFPLSQKTFKGLEFAKYSQPTEIQRECIGLALQGNDILGAAKTGSGKTLAFLIPVLERLFRLRWTTADGLGALIISPTRELVYQTFTALKAVGKFHQLSGGVVFGAKDKKGKKKDGTKRYLKFREEEAKTIHGMNIVIGTPGRLRELMDISATFRTENLKILVLDEADLCLDLGFKNDMDAILEYLPTERQTLLFSATQTKSVKELARCNLKDPVYVSVHENAQHSTPTSLHQSYIVCELHEKLDVLWSFIRSHLKKKVLVFFATCKQVRFVHEAFCKLRPGTTVLALHGAMKQSKRTEMYDTFCRKQCAILIATDVAARGLDFPAVHWVIQMDCPADTNTYIHRVGRTARYQSDGEALLVLLPSEERAMVDALVKRKIPIERIRINPKETTSIQRKLDTLCAEHIYLKEYAQRAHSLYLKSVFTMADKAVFDVKKLDVEKFARSFGLAQPPRVRFLQREDAKQRQKLQSDKFSTSDKKLCKDNAKICPPSSSEESSEEDSDISDMEDTAKKDSVSSQSGGKPEGNVSVKKQNDRSAFNFHSSEESSDDDDDDIFKIKRTIGVEEEGDIEGEQRKDVVAGKEEEELGLVAPKEKVITKFALAKKVLKKNLKMNTRTTFDEEGEVVKDIHRQVQLADDVVACDSTLGGIDIIAAKKRMEVEDKFDKKLYQEKIRKKHKEQRLKEKEERRAVNEKREAEKAEKELEVRLPGSDDEDEDDVEQSDHSSDERKSRNTKHDDNSNDSGDEDDDTEEEDDMEEEDCKSINSSSEEEETEEDGYKDDKRMNVRTKEIKKRRRKKSDESFDSYDEDNFDTGFSLCDDESIALKLLSNS